MEQVINILVVLLVLATIALVTLIIKLNRRHTKHKESYGKLYNKYSTLHNNIKLLDSKDLSVLSKLIGEYATVHNVTMKIHATNIHGEEVIYDGTATTKELTVHNLFDSDPKKSTAYFLNILGHTSIIFSVPEIFNVLNNIGFSLVNNDKRHTLTNVRSSVRKIYALDESKEVLDINKFNALNNIMPLDSDYMASPLLVLIECTLVKESIIEFKENNVFKRVINPYLIREEKKYGKLLKVSTSLKLAKIEYENETKIVKIYSL